MCKPGKAKLGAVTVGAKVGLLFFLRISRGYNHSLTDFKTGNSFSKVSHLASCIGP